MKMTSTQFAKKWSSVSANHAGGDHSTTQELSLPVAFSRNLLAANPFLKVGPQALRDITEDNINNERLSTARGAAWALLLSVPFWVALLVWLW